ncbi:tyrosine-protein phosphatase [Nocardia sp. XZ_19_385]|uniref:tyrosine-protein phosphatase n=1 Tax=Nocardia sp. XZ_19_385 TaxID=2769488 RepID=UPI0018900CB5|nr:tyrosine-protein phosphatase [Nocardia sp. XZ_19_385]
MKRHIEFDRLHNFRDLGGYRSADGRTVAWGLLYRSDSLGKLRDNDWDRFLELGVDTVIDLRYPWEIDARGRIPQPERFRYANCSIEHRPYDQADIDPDIDPWRYLADRFAEVATDGVAEIRETLELIATAAGPAVFHCASGKDRTGLIAALLLSILEISEDQILADFALTERATAHFITEWEAANPDRVLRWPSYGRAPAEVMRLVLHDLTTTYGSARDYLTGTAGLGEDVIDQLKSRLLVPDPHR